MIEVYFIEGPWHGLIKETNPLVKIVYVEEGLYRVKGNMARWEAQVELPEVEA